PIYVDKIYKELIDLKPDGTFRLNMDYFDYCAGLTMTNDRFSALFGSPVRQPEMELKQEHMDLARSIQDVTEEVMLRLGRTMHAETGMENLCMAGGVALNCVANGRLLREGPFKNIWIQPAAGDAGGSLGAALSVWYQYLSNPRSVDHVCGGHQDGMKGSYLGPQFTSDDIQDYLDGIGARYQRLKSSELV